MREYNVAVAGATGAVGACMKDVLEQREFPVKNLRLLASSRSAGKTLKFKGQETKVEELNDNSFNGIEIALFALESPLSREFAPKAVASGAVVIDNSKAFRMEKEVPLVVPEVNPQDIRKHKGIIANPNCSTIQMVVALKPIYDEAGIERVVVTTFQSVSGTGLEAMDELMHQSRAMLEGKEPERKVYPYRIAFNVLPQIESFLPNAYTTEEMKLVNETRKIMGDDTLRVTPTAIRVPILIGHSESVNVQTKRPLSPERAREVLKNFPGIIVVDDPEKSLYPMPNDAEGRDEVFVGRIRKDESVENGINMWVVADNLRKGAATNAVQIAEELIKQGLK